MHPLNTTTPPGETQHQTTITAGASPSDRRIRSISLRTFSMEWILSVTASMILYSTFTVSTTTVSLVGTLSSVSLETSQIHQSKNVYISWKNTLNEILSVLSSPEILGMFLPAPRWKQRRATKLARMAPSTSPGRKYRISYHNITWCVLTSSPQSSAESGAALKVAFIVHNCISPTTKHE